MKTLSSQIIRLLQKNKFIARTAEDMYSRIPYNFMDGKALNPLSVVLLLTYRCNLRCKMCFYYNEAEKSNTESLIHRRKSEELTIEQIKKLIDDISKMNVKVLTLHGGEPLVYAGVFEISKYAASKGLLVNFITNGFLLNEKIIDQIIDARINSITISMDGPEYIHDKVRGMKGAFKKIMEGILILRDKEREGKSIPKLSISTYISAMNQDAVIELCEIIKTTGIKDWNIGLVTYNSEKLSAATKKILGIGGSKGQGDLSNLPDEIVALNPGKMLELRERLKKENVNAGLQITFPSQDAIKKYSDPGFNEINYCLYPWARIIVSPYGEVFPCIPLSMVSAEMGNIKEESIEKIWNGEKYREFRKKLRKNRLLPICSKCCTVNNVKIL
jgi:radical SAM protein with 4Fe4S-binding SPASM domain